MSYKYEELKPHIFTDAGQRDFLKVRDNARRLLKEAGSFRTDGAWKGISGTVWFMLACVDRLVELGEIREVSAPFENVPAQHRVFADSGLLGK